MSNVLSFILIKKQLFKKLSSCNFSIFPNGKPKPYFLLLLLVIISKVVKYIELAK